MHSGTVDERRRKQGKELADLQEKINNPEFVETLLVGVDCTLRTSNEKKIERFATILGGELASDQGPNWDEVAALIRDLSELPLERHPSVARA